MRDVRTAVYRFISTHRRLVQHGAYGATAAAAYLLAYLLRFDFDVPERYAEVILRTLPALLVIRAVSQEAFKLLTGRWRYMGVREVVRLVGATGAGSVLFFLLTLLWPGWFDVPRSVVVLEWVFTTYLTAGLWLTYRLGFETLQGRNGEPGVETRDILIVGAGEAGSRIARETLRSSASYRPVGFVDDDPLKRGMSIHGIDVLGSVDELPRLAEARNAQGLIIAIPSAEPADLRRVVERCEETGLPTKVLPGIADVLRYGRVTLDQLRDVEIEDLLGRDPVSLSLPELADDVDGRVVLITGGAGSIGSELARQVALHGPGKLVLLDQSESDLYFLEIELRERFPDLEIVPVVGDILDGAGLERVFRVHGPDRVFHAAAYKHVPLMQANLRVAVRNNVVGTLRVAAAAARSGVEKFVLVSTDKAVRPASVMGATKRVAELLVLALARRHPDTWFVVVRFGNVLGSKGSVVPLFKKQLEERRKLTVTHPDVSRYFMTIAEAVQLVLQASLLSRARGRVVMLEMGEPVRIVELARNLIRLAGLEEGVDAEIEFIGLRPGEKLTEELTGTEEELLETSVEKIQIVDDNGGSPRDVLPLVEELSAGIDTASESELLGLLHQILPPSDAGRLRNPGTGSELSVEGVVEGVR